MHVFVNLLLTFFNTSVPKHDPFYVRNNIIIKTIVYYLKKTNMYIIYVQFQFYFSV